MRINYCKEHAIALLIARDADSGCRHGMQARDASSREVDDVRREVEFPLSTMHAASSAGTHAVPIRPDGSSVESCVRRVITI